MTPKEYKAMRAVENVVATMAIEDMYLEDDFIRDLYMCMMGKKSTEEMRREIIGKYARH